jgi:hypothetical protein
MGDGTIMGVHIQMNDRILVVIPTLDVEKGEKAARIIKMRAGVNCQVLVVEDVDKKGWVTIHNDTVKQWWDKFDYYVYGCDDYYPARNFLKQAYLTITDKGCGLLGFNDGKWNGNNATVGMVAKRCIHEFYGGRNIFYEGYNMYAADPDLTARAKKLNRYYYDKDAIYMEVDYDKDVRTIEFDNDNKDHQLFIKRREEGFPIK